MTGGDGSVGFIPGIAWCEMSSAWRPNNLASEVQAIDYAGDLRWINPWGPYPRWNAGVPYVNCEWDQLVYWCAAKDVREERHVLAQMGGCPQPAVLAGEEKIGIIHQQQLAKAKKGKANL